MSAQLPPKSVCVALLTSAGGKGGDERQIPAAVHVVGVLQVQLRCHGLCCADAHKPPPAVTTAFPAAMSVGQELCASRGLSVESMMDHIDWQA